MKYVTVSMKELKEESKKWAKRIEKDYYPDLIVYIAKAGSVIGNEFSKEMNIPMIGVETVRKKGNGIKNRLAPIIRKLPNCIRNFLISIELISGIHKRNSERKVIILDDIKKYKNIKRILVVDDSVDTGASVLAVKEVLKKEFGDTEIRIAGLNVWKKSDELIHTDYALYKNTIIKAPMSKDSDEYELFLREYQEYQENKSGRYNI